MRYGTLTKELGYRGLLFLRSQTPLRGYSFETIVSSVRSIQHVQDDSEHPRPLWGKARVGQ